MHTHTPSRPWKDYVYGMLTGCIVLGITDWLAYTFTSASLDSWMITRHFDTWPLTPMSTDNTATTIIFMQHYNSWPVNFCSCLSWHTRQWSKKLRHKIKRVIVCLCVCVCVCVSMNSKINLSLHIIGPAEPLHWNPMSISCPITNWTIYTLANEV